MKPIHLLQGRPLGFPLHTILVHFPIALFVLTSVLDVYSRSAERTSVAAAARYALAGGIMTAAVAALAGLADYSDIRRKRPGKAKSVATRHMMLNLAAVGLYVASYFMRGRGDVEVGPAAMILALIGLAIIMYSGYLGGDLVYNEGVGAGRHRRDHTPEVVEGSGDLVDVGPDRLQDGQTKSVAVGEVRVCVARFGGRYFAVQEYCTHRCGPLSEGSVEDGCVRCPWHNSKFELSSGAVKDGPAKVELKQYDVLVQDNRVLIKPARGS
jgi:uncharacterized membrane protein/nitrite reductase/ring-hydroxylating ferredoxin subunit